MHVYEMQTSVINGDFLSTYHSQRFLVNTSLFHYRAPTYMVNVESGTLRGFEGAAKRLSARFGMESR